MAINFESVKYWINERPWIISLLVVLLTYWQLPLMYFEQDEWQAFETYINTSEQSLVVCASIQRPLTCVFNTIEWRFFGTHAFAYGLTSLTIILAITYVFYRLLRRLNLSVIHSVLGAALFPIFAAGSQAITWFGAFSASLPSFLFGILALDYFIQHVQRPAVKSIVLTLLCFIASLYFKEETLWLGPVFFTIWLVLRQKSKTLKRTMQHFMISIGPAAIVGIVYLALERLRQIHSLSFSTLVSSSDSQVYIKDVIETIYLLPLTHLSQIIITPNYTDSIARAWQLTIPQLSLGLTLVFFAYIIYVLIKVDKKEIPATIVLTVWALFGLISYAVFGKNPEVLEGRYFFGTQAAVVTLLVIGLVPDRAKTMTTLQALGIAVLLVLVGINFSVLRTRLSHSLKIADERRDVISFIQQAAPRLGERSVIYTETSNYGYVGQAAAIMPFQNGLGTTLRVLYQGKDQDYRPLAKKQAYLWNLLNQGYDEIDGLGFGYFREITPMSKAIDDYQIPIENIHAFRYTGTTMMDIGDSIRSRLAVIRQGIEPITREGWTAKSSNDAGVDERHGIDKVLDGNPKSDWSVSHLAGAYIMIDMNRIIDRFTKITLRTGDGNSYPRFVAIEVSTDGKKWNVYEDVGAIDGDMQSNFTVPAQSARYFRVTILDKQPVFFDWSLSDVMAYTLKEATP